MERGKMVEGEYKQSSDTPTHLELCETFLAISGITHTFDQCSSICTGRH